MDDPMQEETASRALAYLRDNAALHDGVVPVNRVKLLYATDSLYGRPIMITARSATIAILAVIWREYLAF
jgi:hypothetical protein